MIIEKSQLDGVFLIEPQPISDFRGQFARVFCAATMRHHGLVDQFVQMNHALSVRAGTVRGLHYQIPPHAETKLVRCTRGEVFDVVVDVRRGSPTFLNWFGIKLSSQVGNMVYVPGGFAHGYQALTDGAEVFYQASTEYAPQAERQIRFDDPRIGIRWPIHQFVLSEKDRLTPNLAENFEGIEGMFPTNQPTAVTS